MSTYDQQIIDLVADRPLSHSEIADRLAPGDNRAWGRIGNALTKLYRSGLLSRERTGRYWYYRTTDGQNASGGEVMMMQHHCCAVCKRNDIKLYRYYGSFLRDEEIFCKAHAPEGAIEQQFLVPLCEDEDGSVWGYTSVPDDAIARWEALPD